MLHGVHCGECLFQETLSNIKERQASPAMHGTPGFSHLFQKALKGGQLKILATSPRMCPRWWVKMLIIYHHLMTTQYFRICWGLFLNHFAYSPQIIQFHLFSGPKIPHVFFMVQRILSKSAPHPTPGDATSRACPSSNASSRVLLSASAPANNRTHLS